MGIGERRPPIPSDWTSTSIPKRPLPTSDGRGSRVVPRREGCTNHCGISQDTVLAESDRSHRHRSAQPDNAPEPIGGQVLHSYWPRKRFEVLMAQEETERKAAEQAQAETEEKGKGNTERRRVCVQKYGKPTSPPLLPPSLEKRFRTRWQARSRASHQHRKQDVWWRTPPAATRDEETVISTYSVPVDASADLWRMSGGGRT